MPAVASTDVTSNSGGSIVVAIADWGPTTTVRSVPTEKFAAYPKMTSRRMGRTTSIAIVRRSRLSSRNSLMIIDFMK